MLWEKLAGMALILFGAVLLVRMGMRIRSGWEKKRR